MGRREDARQRFLRLANARVNKALKAIALVGNLSNRSNYSYSDRDVARILSAVEGAVRNCKWRFDSAGPTKGPDFKLDG
jgi:hypothetical protein